MKNNLFDQVEKCLQDFPETSNSDFQLQFRLISIYFPEEMKKLDGKWFISTYALKEIDKESVKRYRALLNAKGLYLPTDDKVLKARRLKEEECHNEFSPSNPSTY